MEYAHISRAGTATVTAIITAAKVSDALNDPIMGSLVDKTHTRFGKLRPYIIAPAGLVALFLAFLFCVSNGAEPAKLVFLAFVMWPGAFFIPYAMYLIGGF